MTKPFYKRLREYFSNVAKVLNGNADAASIFPNSTDIGTSREKLYEEFLKLHLPNSCSVVLGGFLFDQEGNESRQIDIIVINNQSPQFNFRNQDGSGKSFSCIDGCLAVVSVKSNLDTKELINSLNNLASLPEKSSIEEKINPSMDLQDYDDWPYKVIFAFNGNNVETTQEKLEKFYLDNDVPMNKRPNMIHVLGNYVITRDPRDVKTRNGEKIPANKFYTQTRFPDEFGFLYVIINIQNRTGTSNQIFYDYDEILNNLSFD